jgi:uncharacterized protein (TIGR04206 family)
MFPMGYGLGVFLLAVGLILVFAVQDAISAVDLRVVGWILVLAGVLVIALTAVTMRSRTSRTVATTTHADGTQTTTEQASRQDPPAV